MLSTADLLQKYDVPGPRYTSYPTVPIWSEDITDQHYAQSLSAIRGEEPLSLYFHLPFCEQLCHFCGCMQVITKDHSRSLPYIQTLLKEIELVFAKMPHSKRVVSQIHFGGGTPNFVQPEELSLVMQAIRQHCHVLDDAEIAIEMHPRTSTHAFCENLAKEGFNRISLGVQDFDDEVQKLIHRFQSFEMTAKMIQDLQGLGFEHFNFDLVYGLPGQNESKFADTLNKTLELNPDRLAVYSYAHVPWIRPVQRSFKDSDLPSPTEKLKLFEMALNFFEKHGYHLIGMDHFAKTSDELFTALQNKTIHRNFMGYSTRADAHQIGFGVSSISYVNGNYFQNKKKLPEYEKSVSSGNLTTHRGFLLSPDDHTRRDLITDIMCRLEVDIPVFSQKHGIDFWEYFKADLKHLETFIDDQLLTLDDKKLKIINRGHLIIRNIAMCFDVYLKDIQKNAHNPVFSRTV